MCSGCLFDWWCQQLVWQNVLFINLITRVLGFLLELKISLYIDVDTGFARVTLAQCLPFPAGKAPQSSCQHALACLHAFGGISIAWIYWHCDVYGWVADMEQACSKEISLCLQETWTGIALICLCQIQQKKRRTTRLAMLQRWICGLCLSVISFHLLLNLLQVR